MTHLISEVISCQHRAHLHHSQADEDEGEESGEGVRLLDCSTTPNEGDNEDKSTDEGKEGGRGEQGVGEEVHVLRVGGLNQETCHQKEKTKHLKV